MDVILVFEDGHRRELPHGEDDMPMMGGD